MGKVIMEKIMVMIIVRAKMIMEKIMIMIRIRVKVIMVVIRCKYRVWLLGGRVFLFCALA